MAVIDLVEQISKATNDKQYTVGVFIAFQSVDFMEMSQKEKENFSDVFFFPSN